MSISHISPHFSWAEMECHDGTGIPLDAQPHMRRLCEYILEPIRAQWGGPLVIVSGHRSRAWNARVGGAKDSRHVVGDAADIRPVMLEKLPSLKSMIEDMLHDGRLPIIGGLGMYKTWIHVDGRPRKTNGALARWTGVGFGSEVA